MKRKIFSCENCNLSAESDFDAAIFLRPFLMQLLKRFDDALLLAETAKASGGLLKTIGGRRRLFGLFCTVQYNLDLVK